MKRKQGSLGDIVRKRLQEIKEHRIECVTARVEHMKGARARREVTAEEIASVEWLFENAQAHLTTRLRDSIPYNKYEFPLGVSGLATAGWKTHEDAVILLEQESWPLTVGEGLQRRDNRFHHCWKALCQWAETEDLVIEFIADQNPFVVSVEYMLRVKPRETWVVLEQCVE